MMHIAVTIDVDWAPKPVVDWVIDRLSLADVPATFFATDEPRLASLPTLHEVAIHPNPARLGATSMLDEIKRLAAIYSQARGVRMHRLAWDYGIEGHLLDLGIEWVSTIFLPNQVVLPSVTGMTALHFPIFYMDHHELIHPEVYVPPFSLSALRMQAGRLHVFDFHPNMLFTNAPTELFYREQVHCVYHDVQRLKALRHVGRGCCDLFDEILALRAKEDIAFLTLSEASRLYR